MTPEHATIELLGHLQTIEEDLQMLIGALGVIAFMIGIVAGSILMRRRY